MSSQILYGYNPKDWWKEGLSRNWMTSTPHALLVGMQISPGLNSSRMEVLKIWLIESPWGAVPLLYLPPTGEIFTLRILRASESRQWAVCANECLSRASWSQDLSNSWTSRGCSSCIVKRTEVSFSGWTIGRWRCEDELIIVLLIDFLSSHTKSSGRESGVRPFKDFLSQVTLLLSSVLHSVMWQ